MAGERSGLAASEADNLIADAPARFLADLVRCVGSEPSRLALAVSGGPDSMAMLVLATRALAGRVVVATVDHGLRDASAKEAAMVARRCAELGVPHATLVPQEPIAGASIQARAREARYALLGRWAAVQGAQCVATAHHADDQAETFLMRASRGSGLSGLAGIRPVIEIAATTVVRPLLSWRRAELRAIVRRERIAFVDDPSNLDPRYDRARFRQLLEQNEWLDPPALAVAAEHLAEADTDMRAAVTWLWNSRAVETARQVDLDAADLPRELRRRLCRRAIGRVRDLAGIALPAWSEATGIEPLLDALEAGKGATQAGVMGSAKGKVWRFRVAPPRRDG